MKIGNDILKIGFFGFSPIIIGGFIYLICRQKTILLFNWIKFIKMENEANIIREHFSRYYLPEWIKFNLPDLLWVFGFTSVMLIIWNGVHSEIRFVYFLTPLSFGITTEFLQYFIPDFGTFDLIDLLFYTLGTILSILISKIINK